MWKRRGITRPCAIFSCKRARLNRRNQGYPAGRRPEVNYVVSNKTWKIQYRRSPNGECMFVRVRAGGSRYGRARLPCHLHNMR